MKINFCSLPFLDSAYENVIDFENVDSQINYFKSKTVFSIDINQKPDSLRDSVTVNSNISRFNDIDYIWCQTNLGRINYFFVTGKEYVNTENTTLYLKLDVFQTYLFNYKILESFVDRCHVPRWIDGFPTLHTIDEGLDMGEIEQVGEPIKICDFNDSIVITSTVPIGKVPNVGGGGGTGGSGDCWQNGQLSPKGFRFIKGFEGFAPREYQDSGGYWTIAYGVTKHGEPDIYSQLVGMQPVPEEKGAMISYDLKTKRYGIPILDSVKGMGITQQCQFDALLSVAYNSGNGSITGSNSLTNAIAQNPNDEATIRPVWEKFKITSNGIPLEGLRLRRIQECNLYFNKEVEIRPIGLINTSGNVSGTVTDNNGDGWLPEG